MTERRIPDRWATRDLPFLIAAAPVLDSASGIFATEVPDLDMSREDRIAAAMALLPTHVTGRPMDSSAGVIDVHLAGLTERGRRAVGLWPSDDTAQALVEALEQAAEQTGDPEEQSRLRKAAKAAGRVSQGILTEVVAAVVSRQITGP